MGESKPRVKSKGEQKIEAALKRSLQVIGVLVLLVAVAVAWHFRPKPAPPIARTQLAPPSARETPTNAVPRAFFKDVTTESGIRFVHENGAYGDKLLPETMGSGVAFLDVDGDGAQDLLFVNSAPWPWHAEAKATQPTLALYKNDGHGKFTDITAGSGLDVSVYGMGVAVGDYDNDGKVDVFLSMVGGGKLFHNDGGGRFRDVTAEAGVGGDPGDWSTSCTWLDYDNDGKLDLFVCNYVQWSRAIDFEVDYRLVGIGRAHGPPMNFAGSFPRLYRNLGGGKFVETTAAAKLQVKNRATGLPMAKSLGVAPIDINGDGWTDLIVANDTVQNFVFTNAHDGTFREVGATAGVAFDNYGGARGAMGIDSARFQEDQSLGILIGNFANEMAAFYVSQKDPMIFADEAISQGVGPSSRLALTFGVFFFDYDLDGWLDLLTANGHIEEEIGKIQSSQKYRQPAMLYWNLRGAGLGGGFTRVPEDRCGTDLLQPVVGRGCAFADIDGDGDLDVVITQNHGAPLLLRNDQTLGNRWIRLKLTGTRSNRDGIGAWIKVRVAGRVLWRHVSPTRGYLSQSELPVTIGLGREGALEGVEVHWPSGVKQTVSQTPLGSTTVVTEPAR